ncbi:MAG TPA: DUF1553 domain-containing protein, partial [Pirellulaceae bacterium]|nr:DUF1553 domain-containing protein [Pirellulaceae bacterium]
VKPKERVVYAYLPGEKEAWEAEQRRLTDELAALRRGFSQWLSEHREPGEVLFRDNFDASDKLATLWSATAPRDNRPGGKITVDATGPDSARIVDGKLQIVASPGEGWLSTKTEFDWSPDIVGDWIQVTFDLVDNKVGGGAAERIGYTLAAHDYDDDGPAEGSAVAGGNLLVDGNPSTATSLYLDYPGGDQKIIGAIGQQGYVPGRNYGVRVTRLDGGKLRLEHLVDFLPDGKSLDVNDVDLPPGGFAFFFCCNRSYIVDNVLVERSLVAGKDAGTGAGAGRPDIAKLREEVKQKRDEFERELKRLEGQRRPNPGRPIAWVTDRSTKPPAVPFLRRGLYHLKEHSVEPDGLAALTDAGREFTLPASSTGVEPTTTGRRLAFAEWLTRDDGRPAALMARVQANRIWRQYFGRGIVATTDNLGQSGSPPTHPELLDHLAASWIRHGWSGKRL